MRLNWFSPLPPAKSGIADYTLRLLPALAECAEIVLWTEQDRWDSGLEDYAEVRSYRFKDIPWAQVNRATMSVFHIGNNHRFHGNIWQVSQCHRGLVILHDTALQQLFAGLYREHWHDRVGYLELMEHYYGSAGRQDAEDFWAGRLSIEYMAQQYRLAQHVMEHALGVLVHSPRSRDELQRESPCPLVYVPLPYPVSPPPTQRLRKTKKPRSAGPPFRLIMFGHISDNRRLVPVLQALADFSARGQFRLDVYGELWDRPRVCQHIEALGLRGLVTLHDFVPSEELEAALEAAHLAINLRFPTMGEASVSQLQIWDHALPSLVSKVGWYATLPPEVVTFVRPNNEIMDIQAHLRAFLTDSSAYVRMGENGRRLLETRHTPAAYAEAVVNLVGEAQLFRRHSIVHDLARRVGKEMHQWTNVQAPDLAANVWGQGSGGAPAEIVTRQPLEEVENHYIETLKRMRQLLSDQSYRIQRQLSAGLHALRRAAAQELYPSSRGPLIDIERSRDDMAAEHTGLLRGESQPVLELPQRPPQAESAPCEDTASARPDLVLSRSLDTHGAMGEGGPRKSYTREDALRYPMSIQAHDTGFRYLFNFMVVAKSLGLRPGDAVLDFGAGSCFVSELLNRFGYITVAFDIDRELLAIGQERLSLDPRCDAHRARFVAGDGMRLPFRDQSFDGVICMNALHHMPDYRATLAELYRVLKPGGRAVFAEPGDQHSKSPESILAMEQYGALERDVVLAEIHQLAKEMGFRRMVLKPYVLPEMVELDYEEFEGYGKGEKVAGAFLLPAEIADFVRSQPLFYLEKVGTRPLTSASAPAASLRAKITIKECPTQIEQGGSLKVVALCENVGQSLWLARPTPFGGYVTFGVKLLSADGRVLEDSEGRQFLADDVPPGGRVEVVTKVSWEGLRPGSYRVLFDMVNEFVCWFQNVGSEVVERWIEVM